jgi:hypothetical protein
VLECRGAREGRLARGRYCSQGKGGQASPLVLVHSGHLIQSSFTLASPAPVGSTIARSSGPHGGRLSAQVFETTVARSTRETGEVLLLSGCGAARSRNGADREQAHKNKGSLHANH